MAAFWFRRNEWLKGGALWLAYLALLRPLELRRLCSEDSIHPCKGTGRTWSVIISPVERGRSSQTGRFDDSVVLDTPQCQPNAGTLAENVAGQWHGGCS